MLLCVYLGAVDGIETSAYTAQFGFWNYLLFNEAGETTVPIYEHCSMYLSYGSCFVVFIYEQSSHTYSY